MTLRLTLIQSSLAAALLLSCGFALAQYQWRDENGRMVFSDKAPPSHIKPEQVIRAEPKRPTTIEVATQSAADGPRDADGKGTATGTAARETPAKSDGEPTKTALTQADRDLESKRKQQEQANADKKRRDQAEVEAKVAKACEEMRGELRNLESGMRIARVNTQGEREFMSDDERSKRMESVKKDVKESCKPA